MSVQLAEAYQPRINHDYDEATLAAPNSVLFWLQPYEADLPSDLPELTVARLGKFYHSEVTDERDVERLLLRAYEDTNGMQDDHDRETAQLYFAGFDNRTLKAIAPDYNQSLRAMRQSIKESRKLSVIEGGAKGLRPDRRPTISPPLASEVTPADEAARSHMAQRLGRAFSYLVDTSRETPFIPVVASLDVEPAIERKSREPSLIQQIAQAAMTRPALEAPRQPVAASTDAIKAVSSIPEASRVFALRGRTAIDIADESVDLRGISSEPEGIGEPSLIQQIASAAMARPALGAARQPIAAITGAPEITIPPRARTFALGGRMSRIFALGGQMHAVETGPDADGFVADAETEAFAAEVREDAAHLDGVDTMVADEGGQSSSSVTNIGHRAGKRSRGTSRSHSGASKSDSSHVSPRRPGRIYETNRSSSLLRGYTSDGSHSATSRSEDELVSGSLAGIFGLPEEKSWQERALCAQTDPEAFFPEKGGSTREAKRICTGCGVRAECLEYALKGDERFGIWGGLSERERRRLKRRAV